MRVVLAWLWWLVLSATAAGAVVWFLAFRTGNQQPERVQAPVAGQASISWIDGRDVRINLSEEQDVETVLGVAHGLGRPWLMALYRQAALGRLAEWFGPAAIPLDRHVRALGIPADSLAHHALSPTAREKLERYAEGVRAAQDARAWAMLPALVGREVPIASWRPEHSLAVERLLSWLATTFIEEDTDVSQELEALLRSRGALADVLALPDFARSAVWATDAHGLFARLPAGRSGVSPYMAVSLTSERAVIYQGATTPGVPFRFCGRDSDTAWCVPWAGRAVLRGDTLSGTSDFYAILVSDGSQVVGARTVVDNRLQVGSAVLEWSGLAGETNANAWLDGGAEFALSGGSPADTLRSGTVTMVSVAPETTALARRIDAVDDTVRYGASLLMDTGSVLPDSETLAGLTPAGETQSYLRNWDWRFHPSSIGASLFDLSQAYGPGAARDSLTTWFGSGRSVWRWERDPQLNLSYPGGTLAGLPSRYGPVAAIRAGHPTSPAWGASRAWQVADPPALTVAWEAYLGGTELWYRRPDVPYDDFLARYEASPVRAELAAIGNGAISGVTRVTPLR